MTLSGSVRDTGTTLTTLQLPDEKIPIPPPTFQLPEVDQVFLYMCILHNPDNKSKFFLYHSSTNLLVT